MSKYRVPCGRTMGPAVCGGGLDKSECSYCQLVRELHGAIKDALELADVMEGSGLGMLRHEPYKSKMASVQVALSKVKLSERF